jgi:hypothetical protein
MLHAQPVDVDWHISTFCAAGNCLAAGADGDTILVRDTKDPEGRVLTYSRDEWEAFLDGIMSGDFTFTK